MKRSFGDPEMKRPGRPDRWEDDEPTEVISLPRGWLETPHPADPDSETPPPEQRRTPSGRRAVSLRVVQVIGYVTGIIQGLLLIRVFFRAIGANPIAPAAQWVYVLSEPLIAPFVGLLPEPRAGDFALELTTLFAVVVYTVAGFLLRRLVAIWAPTRPTR